MNFCDKYADMLRLGQEEGLRYCITKFGSALRFFAYKIIKNKESAEDIVSESFVKLWNNREKANSIQSIKVFLYLITRNACYDYLGAQYQQRTVLTEESILEDVEDNFDILSKITYNELVYLISKEVEKLPSRQGEVFRMAYIEGLETEEICDNLNISSSNVYFTKSKALANIRKFLKFKGMI